MNSFICRRRNGFVLAIVFSLALATILIATTMNLGSNRSASLGVVAAAEIGSERLDQANNGGGLSSYFKSARDLLSTSLDAHNQARVYSSLMPNEDPRTAQMLRETIDQTSNLIQSYQQDGLSNLPPLPNVPGLNTIMRLPDKLLRTELSMLQDVIRMAQEMRERPLTATINTPRELTTMFARMAQQLSS